MASGKPGAVHSPPVTMIWAWLMFGEPLSWAMAVGLVVSLFGILIVAKAQAPVHP